MTRRLPLLILGLSGWFSWQANAAVLTVTTTNNVSPAAGQTSLLQALTTARDGDEIRFNIPGTGPHYITTPDGGYPFITNRITLNGYSQPGAAANSSSILAPNNARIQIVLDSRGGGHRVMTFPLIAAADDRGYEPTEGAVLGFYDVTGVRVQGLAFLGVPKVGTDGAVDLYFISFGRGASGQISGCWLGVDPDAKTVAGAANGITGFRYRGRDAAGTVTNTVLVNNLVIGVEAKATNAVQQFNVIVGMPAIPIIVEGSNTRISGNFVTVLPDGLHDFNVAVDDSLKGNFQGAIEIGRAGNNTLIGVDGDGVNDENERNVFGGMLPPTLEGYPHLIEFYGQSPGTNVVLAGNYIGVGIDGKTKFTNGVAVLNGSGGDAEYRIGSNFDGVSDPLEANLIVNNYPPELFPATDFQELPEGLNFLSQLHTDAAVSLRGNSLINNFPFPASPSRDGGQFLPNYYTKALLDPTAYNPILTNSTPQRLRGTVPLPDPSVYSKVVVDVYIADPVGITNGTAAGIPELPQGFLQGLTYLGSFTEGAAEDLNKQAGAFEFDISKLNVPARTQLTVTANYTGTPVGSGGGDGEVGDFTGITRSTDGSVTISWSSGALQSAPAVTGPWTEEAAVGTSVTLTPTEAMKFFRLTAGGGGEPIPAGPAGPPLTSPFSNAVEVR